MFGRCNYAQTTRAYCCVSALRYGKLPFVKFHCQVEAYCRYISWRLKCNLFDDWKDVIRILCVQCQPTSILEV